MCMKDGRGRRHTKTNTQNTYRCHLLQYHVRIKFKTIKRWQSHFVHTSARATFSSVLRPTFGGPFLRLFRGTELAKESPSERRARVNERAESYSLRNGERRISQRPSSASRTKPLHYSSTLGARSVTASLWCALLFLDCVLIALLFSTVYTPEVIPLDAFDSFTSIERCAFMNLITGHHNRGEYTHTSSLLLLWGYSDREELFGPIFCHV